MNERIGNSKIYALAKEAGLIEFEQFAWNPELGSPTYESVAKARKFAELIVQECAEITDGLSKLYPRTDVAFDVGYTMGTSRATKEIKQHFGVEE